MKKLFSKIVPVYIGTISNELVSEQELPWWKIDVNTYKKEKDIYFKWVKTGIKILTK